MAAIANKNISMAKRMGPGVAITITFLSPGVENIDGNPIRMMRAAGARMGAIVKANQGPDVQVMSSTTNRRDALIALSVGWRSFGFLLDITQ